MRTVWSKMERGFFEQPLQLAFIILLCVLTVGVMRNVWSKMERGFFEQPLQLAFYGTSKIATIIPIEKNQQDATV